MLKRWLTNSTNRNRLPIRGSCRASRSLATKMKLVGGLALRRMAVRSSKYSQKNKCLMIYVDF